MGTSNEENEKNGFTPISDSFSVKMSKGGDKRISIEALFPSSTLPLIREERVSPIEFVKMQLDLILRDTPDITTTQKYILSYVFLFKGDFKEKLLEDRICTTKDSANNYESSLRRNGFIVGFKNDVDLNPQIKIRPATTDSGYLVVHHVICDNVETKVKHRNYKRW